MSKVATNKVFLKKNIDSKSDLEFDSNINSKSKDNNNNDNSITTLLQGSQKFKNAVNNNTFANYSTPWV